MDKNTMPAQTVQCFQEMSRPAKRDKFYRPCTFACRAQYRAEVVPMSSGVKPAWLAATNAETFQLNVFLLVHSGAYRATIKTAEQSTNSKTNARYRQSFRFDVSC